MPRGDGPYSRPAQGWGRLDRPMLYGGLLSLAYLALFPYLARRYRTGFGQRRGLYSPQVRDGLEGGSPLWVHAVSVGEVQSAAPFIRRARESGFVDPIVLSTITPTGREMAFRLLKGLFDEHIYYPWDVPWIVDRALNAVRPRAYVALETEVWPGFLKGLKKRNIPSFLVNARFSERSYERCRKYPSLWKKAYDFFELILVRAEDDLERFRFLGMPDEKLVLTGDCKVDALLDRRDKADLEVYKALRGGGRPLFLAGSTHEGEETIVLQAFKKLREQHPGARLVLAPRHPERAGAVLDEAKAGDVPCRLFSGSGTNWSILVVDRVGVLFDLYGVSDGAFVGGSLVPRGGQNVLEPACWGVPFQHGPHMEDFALAASELRELGAGRIVMGAQELARCWLECLQPEPRHAAKIASADYFSRRGGASMRAWSLVEKHIQNLTR